MSLALQACGHASSKNLSRFFEEGSFIGCLEGSSLGKRYLSRSLAHVNTSLPTGGGHQKVTFGCLGGDWGDSGGWVVGGGVACWGLWAAALRLHQP